MRLVVGSMELEDVAQVLEVDRESYVVPWPASAYRREVLHNRNAHYVVLREVSPGEEEMPPGQAADERPRLFPFFPWGRRSDGAPRPGKVVGYAGLWLVIDEAHITTIAVRQEARGNGYGELLLESLIEAAIEMGANRVTLEVRVSNEVAQNLYTKYGFKREGVRTRYYSDNNEDAYIMTMNGLRTDEYRQTFDQQIATLRERLERADVSVLSPVFSIPEDASATRVD